MVVRKAHALSVAVRIGTVRLSFYVVIICKQSSFVFSLKQPFKSSKFAASLVRAK
jgi:hypothetical protein